ncbi:NAD(P)-dependent dehydrogenase (short-subunit alcohol dehydrogenase family) [Bradyrhizobium elkanii]
MKNTPFDLTGQVAVITGSSRGIGRSSAELLAKLGAKVVISSRKADACEEVADGIKKAGGDALVIPCNISRRNEVEALVSGTIKHYGKIDILVCNAAVNPYYGPLLDITDEAFDKIMGANVKSNIWLCSQTIPQMAGRGKGSVVIISSIGGLRGSTVIGAYGISKAADFALCRSARRRVGAEGRARQLRGARPGEDRLRPRAVGGSGQSEAPHRIDAAPPHRRARRDRRRGSLSRLRRLDLHDRPDHRSRRRRHDGGDVSGCSFASPQAQGYRISWRCPRGHPSRRPPSAGSSG